MPFEQLGAILLFLIVVFVFGQFWFHLIESILDRIKRLFSRQETSSAWHPYPSEQKDQSDKDQE